MRSQAPGCARRRPQGGVTAEECVQKHRLSRRPRASHRRMLRPLLTGGRGDEMVGRRLRLVGLAAVMASLTLAACGGGGKKSTVALTSLGKTLPKAIRDAGEIKVGSDIEYAPVEFF